MRSISVIGIEAWLQTTYDILSRYPTPNVLVLHLLKHLDRIIANVSRVYPIVQNLQFRPGR